MTQQISLWDKTAEEVLRHQSASPGAPVDLAIVGGGYTGLSTALHASARGLSVHVIEAQEIGFGGSGRNSGLVNAGVWLPPSEVLEQLGDEYGPRFLNAFSNAPGDVFDIIEKHQIRCEATRNGTIHLAHAHSGLKNLAAREKSWREMGAPVRLLSADETADMTGSKAFFGGLLDERAGTINPMGYCRGLARAAREAGAEISTGTRATGLSRDGDQWKVQTTKGEVVAKSLVLGTNAYTDRLWPGLGGMFIQLKLFQVATRPLGEMAANILPGRQGTWDTSPILRNFRHDAYGRLIVGTLGGLRGANGTVSKKWARRQIAKVFPELEGVEIEEAWEGNVAMTPDHLPRIVELAPDLYTPIAYNGRGITTGTVFGRAMADLLTGTDKSELPLPVTGLAPIAGAGLRARIYDLAFTANQIWSGL